MNQINQINQTNQTNEMHRACISGNIVKTHELLNLGLDINTVYDIGMNVVINTTFLSTAILNNREDMCLFLIKNKIDLDNVEEQYLLEACNSNMIRVVKILIERGSNVNQIFNKNGHDIVPLLSAIIREYYDLIKVLLEFGADVDILNGICKKIARQIGNIRIIKLLEK